MARVLLAFIALASWTSAAGAESARYRIDPEHATVAFLVEHIGYAKVLGQFLKVEGGFTYDAAARTVSDLAVTIDARSVFSNHAERDAHVRKEDFLHTDAHPVIRFTADRAEPTGEATGRLHGALTVRGVTRPVVLDVVKNKEGPYPWGDNYVMGISARTSVKRSDFGMSYALENNLVADTVDILIELEAVRRIPGPGPGPD